MGSALALALLARICWGDDRAEHLAERQLLVLGQEARGVELAPAQRPIGLVGVGLEAFLEHPRVMARAEQSLLARSGLVGGDRGELRERLLRGAGCRVRGGRGHRRRLLSRRRRLGHRRRRLGSVGRRHGRDAVRTRQAQDLAGIDPVRILHDGGVHAIDVGPEIRIAAILAGEIPQGVALADRVGLGRSPLRERRPRGQGQGEQAHPLPVERTRHRDLPATSVSDMELARRTGNGSPAAGANSTPVVRRVWLAG